MRDYTAEARLCRVLYGSQDLGRGFLPRPVDHAGSSSPSRAGGSSRMGYSEARDESARGRLSRISPEPLNIRRGGERMGRWGDRVARYRRGMGSSPRNPKHLLELPCWGLTFPEPRSTGLTGYPGRAEPYVWNTWRLPLKGNRAITVGTHSSQPLRRTSTWGCRHEQSSGRSQMPCSNGHW